METNWAGYVQGLNQSLDSLQKEIERVERLQTPVSGEWNAATEETLNRLFHVLYSVHEITYPTAEARHELLAMLHRLNNIQETYERLRV